MRFSFNAVCGNRCMELEYVLLGSDIHICTSSTRFLLLMLLLMLLLFFLIDGCFRHFNVLLIFLLLSELFELGCIRSANVIDGKHEAIALAEFGQDAQSFFDRIDGLIEILGI